MAVSLINKRIQKEGRSIYLCNSCIKTESNAPKCRNSNSCICVYIPVLEKTKENGEGEHNEPHDMNQKECLSRERGRTDIPHFTEPQLRNLRARTCRFRAPAPVSHAVHAANRVRPEALHGARRRRHCPTARFLTFAGYLGR